MTQPHVARLFAWSALLCHLWTPPRADCPGAREMLSRVLVLPWNEHYTDEHVAAIADEIVAAHRACREES